MFGTGLIQNSSKCSEEETGKIALTQKPFKTIQIVVAAKTGTTKQMAMQWLAMAL